MSEPDDASLDLPWRRPNDRERALLWAIVDQPFPESRALLAQVEVAEARKGCECGCGTIDLRVDQAATPMVELNGSLAPGEAEVLSETGTPQGGLILFVTDGYLSSLEIYSNSDEPIALPSVDRIRPYVIEDRCGE